MVVDPADGRRRKVAALPYEHIADLAPDIAWSPRGDVLYAVAATENVLHLYRIRPDEPATSQVAEVKSAHSVEGDIATVSQDGKRIALVFGGRIVVVDDTGAMLWRGGAASVYLP
jgi:Tol biopolymer transport system component